MSLEETRRLKQFVSAEGIIKSKMVYTSLRYCVTMEQYFSRVGALSEQTDFSSKDKFSWSRYNHIKSHDDRDAENCRQGQVSLTGLF